MCLSALPCSFSLCETGALSALEIDMWTGLASNSQMLCTHHTQQYPPSAPEPVGVDFGLCFRGKDDVFGIEIS